MIDLIKICSCVVPLPKLPRLMNHALLLCGEANDCDISVFHVKILP